MVYMKLITKFIAGSLLTGILALVPATSFARGGGGGGHFGGGGGGHFGGFHGGPGAGAWHHDGGWAHQAYSGYYSPFDYGLDDYTGPYYDDSDSSDWQPASTGAAPDEVTSLIMSVQKELARLGYYHGQLDGMTGSETAQALRLFQSADKLPVSGQIDSATIKALRIG
jgi:hypothetical protein